MWTLINPGSEIRSPPALIGSNKQLAFITRVTLKAV